MAQAWLRASPWIRRSLCRQRRYQSSATLPAEQDRRPRVIVSGIQPTGIPHLGNYLGALRNWVDLQKQAESFKDELFFFIVGLHAITMPQDPKRLLTERRDMLAALLAVGLDPKKCTIFHQDQVQEHTELAWIFNCITPMGKLNRMTTWKSKLATAQNVQSAKDIDESHLSLGLFAYPVLQAADILLYRATHVPVGEDQVQHLELSRDIADLFNRNFKSRLFALPQQVLTPTKRVLSLRDPDQKMSKSNPDSTSRILLTDSDATIEKKIKRAVTDEEQSISYDPQNRPGVSNLLSIISGLQSTLGNPTSVEEIAEMINRDHQGKGSALKSVVTDTVIDCIRPIRDELQRIKADGAYLDEVEKLGREKAQGRAEETMEKVRRLVGLAA